MTDQLHTEAKVVVVACSNDESCRLKRPGLPVPIEFLEDGGRVKAAHRHKDHAGFYVSPGGNVYCSRQCWGHYCGG